MTDETTTTPEAKEDTAAAKPAEKASTPTPEKRDAGRPARKGRRPNSRTREPKEFEESIINIDRVTRVTRGGRQMRFRVSVVIGNKKGKVGFGIGKSSEVMIGVQKAVSAAKKNMITVPIFEDSLPHEIIGKFKASTILLFPAPEGKGIIAGGAVRKILELAGVKNVLSKMHGSRNRINTTYATINALSALQNRAPMVKKEDVEKLDEGEKNEGSVDPKEAAETKAAPTKTTKKATDKK